MGEPNDRGIKGGRDNGYTEMLGIYLNRRAKGQSIAQICEAPEMAEFWVKHGKNAEILHNYQKNERTIDQLAEETRGSKLKYGSKLPSTDCSTRTQIPGKSTGTRTQKAALVRPFLHVI